MQAAMASQAAPRVVGRYAIYGEIASGGMATVHFGRMVGQVGFSRTVAIKKLHPQFAKDPDFVSMFIDEARLAARIQHPNVVPTVDVVSVDDELFLVMEYVQGESLSKLIRAARRQNQLVPSRIGAAIVANALHGLHAAHEAKSERGQPLNIVHRDISPQNILVGVDGVARVLDFGVAKAAMRATSTRDGQMKGKVAYMAPEQMRGKGVDRRTDIFASGIVLWEALTGRRLFDGNDPGEVLTKLLNDPIPPPSSVEPSVPRKLDEIVMRSLDRNMDARYSTAREFAIALEHTVPLAMPREVGEWVESVGGDSLSKRAEQVAEIESVSSHVGPQVASPLATNPGLGATSSPHHEVPSQVTSPSQVRPSVVSSPSSVQTSPSQVTSLSADYSIPQPPASRRGLLAALVGVAAALMIAFVVVVVALVGRSRGEPSVTAMEPAATAPATATTTVAPVATPAPTPEPAAALPSVTAEPKPAASQATAPKATVKPPAQPTRPPRTTQPSTKPAPAPPPPPPPKNCNPPYTIDAKGIKRAKPECL